MGASTCAAVDPGNDSWALDFDLTAAVTATTGTAFCWRFAALAIASLLRKRGM